MSHSEDEDLEIGLLYSDREIQREILKVLRRTDKRIHRIETELFPSKTPFPSTITFQEISMSLPVAGQTQVYTGTLSPAGATYPSDTTFSLVSSDPTNATATVDSTGLIVTIVYGAGFVENPASPFNVVYTATSASSPAPNSLTATITPSAPASAFPSSISFVETT